MAEDAKVRSKTSSTTKSAKNLLSDVAKDAEVGGNGDDSDDEMIKRLPSRKSNGPTRYFTSLRSDADSIFFGKKWVCFDGFGYRWSSQLEALLKWLQAKFAGITNWTVVRSGGPMSSLDITLHQLLNYDF